MKILHSVKGLGAATARLAAVAAVATAGAATTAMAAGASMEGPALPWGIDGPAGQCVVCHSLEKGGPYRVAPNLWNIVGAEKARDRRWYAYSPGLIRKGGTWTEDDLDEFLADANEFVPGSRKSIRVSDAEERREIIDYLKKLKN